MMREINMFGIHNQKIYFASENIYWHCRISKRLMCCQPGPQIGFQQKAPINFRFIVRPR